MISKLLNSTIDQAYESGLSDGAGEMVRRIRGALANWPEAGIDEKIGAEVERLIKDARKQERRGRFTMKEILPLLILLVGGAFMAGFTLARL
jgi:hypothetical protein